MKPEKTSIIDVFLLKSISFFSKEKYGKEEIDMDNQKQDLSFMKENDSLAMKIIKRRVPMKYTFLKGEDARKHIITLNQFIYFYRYFETRVEIKKGDVFLARFPFECGNELSGNHYVVALLDSNPINQVVTVIPLKSAKGKILNPASDMMLGEIVGLRNGKESVAVINQIRTIDKRRLFEPSEIAKLFKYFSDETIGEYSIIECPNKNVYRLSESQFTKLHNAIRQYVNNGYIKHE